MAFNTLIRLQVKNEDFILNPLKHFVYFHLAFLNWRKYTENKDYQTLDFPIQSENLKADSIRGYSPSESDLNEFPPIHERSSGVFNRRSINRMRASEAGSIDLKFLNERNQFLNPESDGNQDSSSVFCSNVGSVERPMLPGVI